MKQKAKKTILDILEIIPEILGISILLYWTVLLLIGLVFHIDIYKNGDTVIFLSLGVPFIVFLTAGIWKITVTPIIAFIEYKKYGEEYEF